MKIRESSDIVYGSKKNQGIKEVQMEEMDNKKKKKRKKRKRKD